jgi:hypothetical protein
MADFFFSRSTVVRFQLLHNNCLSIFALFDLPLYCRVELFSIISLASIEILFCCTIVILGSDIRTLNLCIKISVSMATFWNYNAKVSPHVTNFRCPSPSCLLIVCIFSSTSIHISSWLSLMEFSHFYSWTYTFSFYLTDPHCNFDSHTVLLICAKHHLHSDGTLFYFLENPLAWRASMRKTFFRYQLAVIRIMNTEIAGLFVRLISRRVNYKQGSI